MNIYKNILCDLIYMRLIFKNNLVNIIGIVGNVIIQYYTKNRYNEYMLVISVKETKTPNSK